MSSCSDSVYNTRDDQDLREEELLDKIKDRGNFDESVRICDAEAIKNLVEFYVNDSERFEQSVRGYQRELEEMSILKLIILISYNYCILHVPFSLTIVTLKNLFMNSRINSFTVYFILSSKYQTKFNVLRNELLRRYGRGKCSDRCISLLFQNKCLFTFFTMIIAAVVIVLSTRITTKGSHVQRSFEILAIRLVFKNGDYLNMTSQPINNSLFEARLGDFGGGLDPFEIQLEIKITENLHSNRIFDHSIPVVGEIDELTGTGAHVSVPEVFKIGHDYFELEGEQEISLQYSGLVMRFEILNISNSKIKTDDFYSTIIFLNAFTSMQLFMYLYSHISDFNYVNFLPLIDLCQPGPLLLLFAHDEILLKRGSEGIFRPVALLITLHKLPDFRYEMERRVRDKLSKKMKREHQ
ncbi:MAG: hypothetical protein MHMPM18_000988 [Marteilia pararefringens]